MPDRRKKEFRDKNQPLIRSRHVLIYTFLIILILMYGSARKEAQEIEAREALAAEQEAAAGEEGAGSDAAEGKDSEESSDGAEAAVEESASGEKDSKQGADIKGTQNAKGTEETKSDQDSQGTGPQGDKKVPGNQDSQGDENAQTASQEQTGLKLSPADMWCLTLTNESYPVPENYPVTLKQLPENEESVDERIYDSLVQMMDAMKQQGLVPEVCSGYRTADKQKSLFEEKKKDYIEQGKTEQEAYDLTKRQISVPGSGEHCMGLAVDFITPAYTELDAGFANTPEAQWLAEHSVEYGFILRYPQGKEDLTGIDFEPWHFRYVGKKAAEYMKQKDLCFEEFYVEESLYG